MTHEVPIELLHLPGKLRTLFTGKLPEARTADARHRESNFLSRALAGLALMKLAGADVDAAAAAIVDGGRDGGIDAVHFDPTSETLWVAQSKWIEDGRGEPELDGVSKFGNGLNYLLQGKFDVFAANLGWGKLLPSLHVWFGRPALRVRAVLVYSGLALISEDRRRVLEDLKTRHTLDDNEYFDTCFCGLTTVHTWLTGADRGPGLEKVELTIAHPGFVGTPFSMIYGLIPLRDVAALYVKHKEHLVAANIRNYRGNTDVNAGIQATAASEPENFVYLNNGLTAYCQRLEINKLDNANTERKRLTAYGFSIVNGAQTLGSVAAAKHFVDTPTGYVFIKIISLKGCSDERAFADRITRTTNFQNEIGARDFAALHPQQEIIARQLVLSGITYHYKADEDASPADANNFSLEEATTACACLTQNEAADFCARVLSNRRSLWSLDPDYPETEVRRTRYERVFRDDRSARTIWRAVQAQRVVSRVMTENARSQAGVRKAFFENSRWLVLNIVFLRLHPENGSSVRLSADEEAQIAAATVDCAEALFDVFAAQGFVSRKTGVAGGESYEASRHPRSVFSAKTDCEALRAGLLRKLTERTASPMQVPKAI